MYLLTVLYKKNSNMYPNFEIINSKYGYDYYV